MKKKNNSIFTIQDINSGNFLNFIKDFIGTLEGNLGVVCKNHINGRNEDGSPQYAMESSNYSIKDLENFSIVKSFKFLVLEDNNLIFWNHQKLSEFKDTTNREIKKYVNYDIYKESMDQIFKYDLYFHEGGLNLFEEILETSAHVSGGGYLDIVSEKGLIKLIFYKESHRFGSPDYKVLCKVKEKIFNKEIIFDFSEYDEKEQQRLKEEHEKEQQRLVDLSELAQKDKFFIRFFHKERIQELKKILGK